MLCLKDYVTMHDVNTRNKHLTNLLIPKIDLLQIESVSMVFVCVFTTNFARNIKFVFKKIKYNQTKITQNGLI